MQVTTTRFGTIEVPDDGLLTFTDGLPGFAGRRTMALLGAGDLPFTNVGEAHHNLYWLQDVDDPDVAFLTIVPWAAYPDYDIEIDPADIDHAKEEDVCVLNVVTVRRADGAMKLTTNLMAPIVIDTARRTGRQIILDDPNLPIQAPLAESSNATGDQIRC